MTVVYLMLRLYGEPTVAVAYIMFSHHEKESEKVICFMFSVCVKPTVTLAYCYLVYVDNQ